MRCPHLPDGFDFTDPDLLHDRVPHLEFASMRETAPVWWRAQPADISGFGDEGCWSVTRHADVKYVSTHPELFSSQTNTAVIRFNETISRDQIDVQKLIMLNMDPPEHTRVRQIVQRGFTPRAIRSPESALRTRARSIVETARNAISHGMHAFLTHPEQWELYERERPRTTAEEIVRWATPVVSFQRTVTEDTEPGGQRIRKGERVGLFWSSADNAPEVFDSPEAFDISRDPNPHLGFGGGGPHFCLGRSPAVLEIDLIFNAIADVLPGLRLPGDPRRLRSAWINGIKQLQVSAAPESWHRPPSG
ncbi:cytochrome P450 [Streptomyces sp. NPDC049916]|uniref:cytochrome P450 n=1 Tax=Streptomyces sp. NPDC049916 TaxID=3155156 RepID=UPI00343B12FB